jgi:hypothetical protein
MVGEDPCGNDAADHDDEEEEGEEEEEDTGGGRVVVMMRRRMRRRMTTTTTTMMMMMMMTMMMSSGHEPGREHRPLRVRGLFDPAVGHGGRRGPDRDRAALQGPCGDGTKNSWCITDWSQRRGISWHQISTALLNASIGSGQELDRDGSGALTPFNIITDHEPCLPPESITKPEGEVNP